jgi:hypothetical protein
VVCNTGTSLVPTIDGKMHHFNNVGLYDALFIMQDSETKTLWNHITGEALYGPLVGRSLGPIGNLLPTNVKEALESDPKTQVAISDRPYYVASKLVSGLSGTPDPGAPRNRLAPDAQLNDSFIQTLGKEDTRRLRMDMGLGVWTDKTTRYYPMSVIRDRGRAFIDHIDGKRALIYIDPETNNPAAMFVDASTARFERDDIRLDNGTVVRSGVLVDHRGKPQTTHGPQQMFTRWYGFALTFPGAEVFGQ